MEMCLHQIARPKKISLIGNRGDCSICKTDEKNKDCPGYTPITVSFVEVENE